MCTQEVCKAGEVSFGSREDWIDHLNLHEVCNNSGLGLVECPFCAMELESEVKDLYLKHVGYHFEEIRLLSLPLYFRRGLDADEDVKDSADDDEPEQGHLSGGPLLSGIVEETPLETGSPTPQERHTQDWDTTSQGDRTANWISNDSTDSSLAVYNGDPTTTSEAITGGSDVNDLGLDGNSSSALRVATGGGHGCLVELSLANDADSKSRDSENQTSLQEAVASGHDSMIQYLRQRGSAFNGQVRAAAHRNNPGKQFWCSDDCCGGNLFAPLTCWFPVVASLILWRNQRMALV